MFKWLKLLYMTSCSIYWWLWHQTWSVKNFFYSWYGWLPFWHWWFFLSFFLCRTKTGLKLNGFLLLIRNWCLSLKSCLFYNRAQTLLIFHYTLFIKKFFTSSLIRLSLQSFPLTIWLDRLLFFNYRRLYLLMLYSFLTIRLKNLS